MRAVALLVLLLLVGCSPTPVAPPAPTTSAPGPAATVLATATNKNVNYKAITQPLLLPLGALIVAVRAGTPTTDYWLAQFNKAADTVLPQIAGDDSATANRLRTGITNIRRAPNDLQVLEDARSMFLSIS